MGTSRKYLHWCLNGCGKRVIYNAYGKDKGFRCLECGRKYNSKFELDPDKDKYKKKVRLKDGNV